MTFVKLVVSPNIVKDKTYKQVESNFRSEGYHMEPEIRQVRRGTLVKLIILDAEKMIDDIKLSYEKVWNAKSDLMYHMRNVGAVMDLPKVLFCDMPHETTEIKSRIIRDELDEGTYYFQIHYGNQGWYIISEAASSKLEITVDDRFPKYFTRDSAIRFTATAETMSLVAVEAEELFKSFTHAQFDTRYRVAGRVSVELRDYAKPIKSNNSLGDLAHFAPKQQRK